MVAKAFSTKTKHGHRSLGYGKINLKCAAIYLEFSPFGKVRTLIYGYPIEVVLGHPFYQGA
jgi:hypothetical protein